MSNQSEKFDSCKQEIRDLILSKQPKLQENGDIDYIQKIGDESNKTMKMTMMAISTDNLE